MNIPSFFYSLKFWEALSVIVAIAAVQLGWAEIVDAGQILAAVLAVLQLFKINPELRARGIIK